MRTIPRLVLLVALACLACAAPEPPAAKTVLMRSETGAVVVLPMNVTTPVPASLDAAAPRVWQMLRAYLEAHDTALKTVAFPTARALWLESVREARGRDPQAGFPEAARVLVAELARRSDLSAVIVPSLFVQGAVVSGRTARWDGVERTVRIDEGAWSDRLDEDTSFGGAVPAASLHAVVLDREGAVVHERQAGLALLASVRLSGRPELGTPGFDVLALDDPLADRDGILDGIALALDPFLTPLPPSRVETR